MVERLLRVEVAFAASDRQEVVALDVPAGSTLLDALRASGLREKFPAFDLERLHKGVWHQARPDDYIVRQGDRIEIYRPLVTDARQARRNRAGKQPDPELERGKSA